jgi:hypothetical protein
MEENTKTTVSKNKQGYGYKYTDLAQIHEYLESINAKYYQYVDRIDSDDYIMTVPIIDGKELQPRRGVRIVDAVLTGIKNPAQEQGSATTYARRYSLLMAFGLATEDDDAASLTQQKKTTTPKKQTTTQQQGSTTQKATPIQIETIKSLVEDIPAMLGYYKIEKIEDLSLTQASEIISKKKGNK